MLIPLGTDRPLSRRTIVTHVLLATNLAVFVLDMALRGPPDPSRPGALGPLAHWLAMDPRTLGAEPWTLVGYAFAHGGLLHLLGNMVVLWVFGPNVEDRLGRLGFAGFYMLGAVAAAGAHLLFSNSPVVGASGAVAAVTGAYLVLFPRTTVRCLLFFVLVGFVNIPALWFVAFAVARDIFGLAMPSNVAREAHLGGYAFGSIVSFVLLATRLIPRETYDMFQVLKRRRRLGEIRAATREASARGPFRTGDKAREDQTPPTPPEAMTLRAEVSAKIAAGDLDGAARTYADLRYRHGAFPAAVCLSRAAMLALGAHLFSTGQHRPAAEVYQSFLAQNSADPERAHITLMLGLIKARYLNEPAAARELITQAAAGVRDESHAALARELLDELAARPA